MANFSNLFSKPTTSYLSSVFLVTFFCSIFEFILLQLKYGIFTGGFLLPFSYLSWVDRTLFISIYLWMDLVLFGALGAIWFSLMIRRGTRLLVASYLFIYSCLSLMGVWLTIEYKVLTYFNDTINFLIIKNLGGGSFTSAIRYVANESSIIIIACLLLFLLFLIGLRIVRNSATVSYFIASGPLPFRKRWLIPVTGSITIGLIVLVNSHFSLLYGLNKTTSYVLISSVLDKVTDVDRDGHGLFSFPVDSAPLDPSVFPGALDIPGNDIDEDGYGGDFTWNEDNLDPLRQLPPEQGSHILLIVLESTRSDLLEIEYAGKPIAPNIAAIEKSGSAVQYAYSHTGYTTTSLTALLNRSLASGYERTRLSDFLSESGYSLSFISGQDESFGHVATRTGMADKDKYLFDAQSALQDRVYPSKDSGSLRLSEDRVVQAFFERSSDVDWKQPQFFYINLQAAHFPYSYPSMPVLVGERPIPRSEISETNRDWLETTYWNAVSVADQAIGRIIQRLKKLGVYDQTLVVIVADHGESLFDDHFLGHGHALDEAQTRIPLIFNRPGIDVKSAVGQVDMADLVVQLATGRFSNQQWDAPQKPVLQIVGSLDVPQLVGTVSYGEIRTILDLRTRKVFFSDLERWEDFDVAYDDPVMGARTKGLINLWESTRWENHLARQEKETPKPPEQTEPL